MPSNFTEPCQGDVIAAELSGQQGGSSRAKECLDIPCGDSALRRIVGWWGCHLTAYRHAGVFVSLEPTLETGPPRVTLPEASSRRYRSPGSLEHASSLATSRPDPREKY
ncbi:solute carrier organic anion transporter family member 3A1 isoform X3 [Tachysurus ichikawai]